VVELSKRKDTTPMLFYGEIFAPFILCSTWDYFLGFYTIKVRKNSYKKLK
jgi:hypothetical protein